MPVSPPRPKGPPLNCLRAFEAAARLGGFAKAADELNVSAGAVSQHIRTLEDWAGTSLFDRRSQGVLLTVEGRRLLPKFTKAFDALAAAVRDLRDLSPNRVVTITALPSIAQLWLQPRLSRFRAALGDVTLSINVTETPPNLDRDLGELGLFMQDPQDCPSGLVMAQDMLTPMCAPGYSTSDLANATLLHDEVWANDWNTWAQTTSGNLTNPDVGPRFSLYAMAVEEAKAGAGLLMGHTALLGRELAAGELIQPFPDQTVIGKCLIADVADSPIGAQLRMLLKSFIAV